jgi:hypothetical protein
VLESLWVARNQQRDRARAARIDRAARFVFPAVYAGMLLAILGIG